MKRYENRRYFTLDDVKNGLGVLTQYSGPFTMEKGNEGPDQFFDSVLKKCGYSSPELFGLSESCNTMWKKYLWPKFWNQYVCFTDNDDIPDDNAAKVFADDAGVIMAWLRSSDEKFKLTIANQEANKDKLLGQIKTTNISRFNDTPQNSGSFEDVTHNTTVTKSESATDGGTLLARLNEVEEKLKRLYDDWSNEFRQFIIWSVE